MSEMQRIADQIGALRAEAQRSADAMPPQRATLIGLLNEKGGVYKTTLAITFGAALAMLGKRVVIVDADPQGHATMRLDVKKQPGLYNLLIRDEEFEGVLRYVSPQVFAPDAELVEHAAMGFIHRSKGELWLLPGNLETRGISFQNPDLFLVSNRFDEIAGWADVVIFDTSPTPSPLNSTIYAAIDGVILPTECTYSSLDGLAGSLLRKEKADTARQQHDFAESKVLGIIPTAYRVDTTAHDIGVEKLREKYKRLVWPPLPQRTIWEQAEWVKESIFRHAPRDVAALEAWANVDRLLKALPEPVR
jgi:chromosome partitioning protein